MVQHCQYRWVW